MKARQGTRTETRRECLTKEKLEKELFADKKDGAHCKHVVVSSSRTVRQERMECSGDEKLSGEMRFEAASREKVNGVIKMSVRAGPPHDDRQLDDGSEMDRRRLRRPEMRVTAVEAAGRVSHLGHGRVGGLADVALVVQLLPELVPDVLAALEPRQGHGGVVWNLVPALR